MVYRFIKPRGYNNPSHWAMLISQWAHQFFLWNWCCYDAYVKIQNKVYLLYGEKS